MATIKKSVVLTEKRHTDQWNRIKNSDIDPYEYAQLIFDEGMKTVEQWKDSFSTNGIGAIGHLQDKSEPQLISYFIQN